MTYTTELVALVLDDLDAEQWQDEHPDLAPNTRIIIANDRGWSALDEVKPTTGHIPSTVSLGSAAAMHPTIGGTDMPRWLRLALTMADHHRPAYLTA